MIDSVRTVSTPEGVELELRAAGVYVRGAALMMDLLIRIIVMFVISIVLAIFGQIGTGIAMIMFFFLEWFYPVYFEVLHGGATPGKKMYGICVVNTNGTPVSWGGSVLRNLLRFADMLPTAYLFGIVSMICTRGFCRLGDLAAGTIVVYKEQYGKTPKIQEVDQVMPAIPLHQHEQRAIIEFAERCEDWAPKRQQELANILEPLTGERDAVGVTRLNGIATYLVSGR